MLVGGRRGCEVREDYLGKRHLKEAVSKDMLFDVIERLDHA